MNRNLAEAPTDRPEDAVGCLSTPKKREDLQQRARRCLGTYPDDVDTIWAVGVLGDRKDVARLQAIALYGDHPLPATHALAQLEERDVTGSRNALWEIACHGGGSWRALKILAKDPRAEERDRFLAEPKSADALAAVSRTDDAELRAWLLRAVNGGSPAAVAALLADPSAEARAWLDAAQSYNTDPHIRRNIVGYAPTFAPERAAQLIEHASADPDDRVRAKAAEAALAHAEARTGTSSMDPPVDISDLAAVLADPRRDPSLEGRQVQTLTLQECRNTIASAKPDRMIARSLLSYGLTGREMIMAQLIGNPNVSPHLADRQIGALLHHSAGDRWALWNALDTLPPALQEGSRRMLMTADWGLLGPPEGLRQTARQILDENDTDAGRRAGALIAMAHMGDDTPIITRLGDDDAAFTALRRVPLTGPLAEAALAWLDPDQAPYPSAEQLEPLFNRTLAQSQTRAQTLAWAVEDRFETQLGCKVFTLIKRQRMEPPVEWARSKIDACPRETQYLPPVTAGPHADAAVARLAAVANLGTASKRRSAYYDALRKLPASAFPDVWLALLTSDNPEPMSAAWKVLKEQEDLPWGKLGPTVIALASEPNGFYQSALPVVFEYEPAAAFQALRNQSPDRSARFLLQMGTPEALNVAAKHLTTEPASRRFQEEIARAIRDAGGDVYATHKADVDRFLTPSFTVIQP